MKKLLGYAFWTVSALLLLKSLLLVVQMMGDVYGSDFGMQIAMLSELAFLSLWLVVTAMWRFYPETSKTDEHN
jgi:hypothetical protein